MHALILQTRWQWFRLKRAETRSQCSIPPVIYSLHRDEPTLFLCHPVPSCLHMSLFSLTLYRAAKKSQFSLQMRITIQLSQWCYNHTVFFVRGFFFPFFLPFNVKIAKWSVRLRHTLKELFYIILAKWFRLFVGILSIRWNEEVEFFSLF